jgi:hypothetical protein
MTVQDDPYVRVQYSLVRDAPLFDDDSLLAWWLRLKLAADGSYPAPANLPRRIGDDTVTRLAELGHIQLDGTDRYFMRTVDEDRGARSAAARKAAEARWAPTKTAPETPPMQPQQGSDAPALHPHPSADAPALHPHPDPERDALRVHDAAHPRQNASPLRSAPSESSVASPPARPGGGGLASIGSTLSDLVPPPPGHRRSGTRPPADEELVAQHRRVLAEPKSPPWLVQQARDGLRVMGYPEEADAPQHVGASRNGSHPP